MPGRSPRARRRRSVQSWLDNYGRSISACAEETWRSERGTLLPRVDLRVCGGDEPPEAFRAFVKGRSPRARRRRLRDGRGMVLPGSISACAEETRRCSCCTVTGRVDLRVRGGDEDVGRIKDATCGRSPRARRRRGSAVDHGELAGSISACAEETRHHDSADDGVKVDLRVRGGDISYLPDVASMPGRSPRARRRLLDANLGAQLHGSISACAEETSGRGSRARSSEVDLRVRGGDPHIELSGVSG